MCGVAEVGVGSDLVGLGQPVRVMAFLETAQVNGPQACTSSMNRWYSAMTSGRFALQRVIPIPAKP